MTHRRDSQTILRYLPAGSYNFSTLKSKVCLNMIAKDEIRVLNETLHAVAPHICSWILCDTGSSDGTYQYTSRFFRAMGIPGYVVHHRWENFARNRNMCLQAGTKMLGDICDYWLLLDADQLMISTDGLSLKDLHLDKDAYWLEERCYGIKYANRRLVKVARTWMYIGEVHEKITTDDVIEHGLLPRSIYTRHDTDGSRPLENDAALLEKALRINPSDSRAHFYLASTFFAMSKFDKAVAHYVERIRLGGCQQEMYYSALRVGMSLEYILRSKQRLSFFVVQSLQHWLSMNATSVQLRHIFAAYTMAIQYSPHRKESRYRIAKLYRNSMADMKKCFHAAADGHALVPPNVTTLFSEDWIVQYGLRDELCICGLGAGRLKEGLAACEELDLRLQQSDTYMNITMHEKLLARARRNRTAYQRRLGKVG